VKIVLTGGGTGGHVYPALAIAEALAEEPAVAPLEVLFAGTRDRLEAEIVPKAGIPIAFVRAAPLERRPSLELVRTAFENLRGVGDAFALVQRFAPDAVIATGGYVTFPVVVAARLARLLHRSRAKIVLLEPNATAGLTNRLLEPLVDEKWVSLPQVAGAQGRRTIVTGTPVRAAFLKPIDARIARLTLGLEPQRTTVAIIGGSQGAHSLNEAVASLLEAGGAPWQILHLTGSRDFAAMSAREQPAVARGDARVINYLADPRVAYAAADLMVVRAGASTLAELAATATPAILVPYPHATGDHQTHNARTFVALGAARLLRDEELSGERLARELHEALAPEAIAAMRRAAHKLAQGDPRAVIRARVKRWSPANTAQP
jgi:UDP-N-acetylglucosamine--N-acetylmuramyl-(pentapeptide) pyrophosphoryl-undecaprenol N-acetylglucosamine transferase